MKIKSRKALLIVLACGLSYMVYDQFYYKMIDPVQSKAVQVDLSALRKKLLREHPQTQAHIAALEHNASLGEERSKKRLESLRIMGILTEDHESEGTETTGSALVDVPEMPKGVALNILSEEECKQALNDREFLRMAAAEGDSIEQFRLAIKLMQEGEDEAVEWFRRAAEQGDKNSQTIMGRLYASDVEELPSFAVNEEKERFIKEMSPPKDYRKALDWFRKAAEQGDTQAQYFLGVMLRDGIGTKQDYEGAYFWLGIVNKNYRRGTQGDLARAAEHLSAKQKGKIDMKVWNWERTEKSTVRQLQEAFYGLTKKFNVTGALCGKAYSYIPADQCGKVVGIDINSGGDGPYYFVDIKTGEVIGSCSFWGKGCSPPRRWTCGRPKNYHG